MPRDTAASHPSVTQAPPYLVPALLGLYTLFALLPLLLADTGAGAGLHFWHKLGNGLAMAGFALLLAEFILSGRFRGVTAPIGIDVTLRFHQLMGHTVLILLLIHPYLYALIPAATQAPGVVVPAPSSGLAEGLTGVIAWLVLGTVVLLAIARDMIGLGYERWRLVHGVGAGVVAVFGLHHTLEAGVYSGQGLLAGFWVLAVAAALFTLVHAYWLVPRRQARAPWRIKSVERTGPGYWDVTVEPEDNNSQARQFRFEAGQFAWLKVADSPYTLKEHPFSIASSPAALPEVVFTIKEAGDFTNTVGELQPGQRAYLDAPHGHFVLDDRPAAGFMLIAGGVGIAPIMSLLRELRARGEQRPVRLVYGVRRLEEALFREELAAAEEALDLQVFLVVDEPGDEPVDDPRVLQGPVTRALLHRCLPERGASDWVHYICGPPAMIDSVENSLEAEQVPLERIRSERFRYTYHASTRRSRRTMAVWAGVTAIVVLAALLFALV